MASSVLERPDTAPLLLGGVDGCPGGWVVAWLEVLPGPRLHRIFLQRYPRFVAVLQHPFSHLAVDIPIGLLDHPVSGGRVCDREARRLLGRPRAASVFSPPPRSALRARSFSEALRQCGGKGIHQQAFRIAPKILEVDQVLNPDLQQRVREAHPELAFLALAGGPLQASKHSPQGRSLRKSLLLQGYAQVGIVPSQMEAAIAAFHQSTPRRWAGEADILDALALAWTAWRILQGMARRIPSHPPTDARGLRMEIWF